MLLRLCFYQLQSTDFSIYLFLALKTRFSRDTIQVSRVSTRLVTRIANAKHANLRDSDVRILLSVAAFLTRSIATENALEKIIYGLCLKYMVVYISVYITINST